MARLRFPEQVDMAYAASAPMKFYAQQVEPGRYYQHITKVAEEAVPGCAAAVRSTLERVSRYILAKQQQESFNVSQMESVLGICPNSLPTFYITSRQMLVDELQMVVAYTFANHNMGYYPPSPQTALVKGCNAFLGATNMTTSPREGPIKTCPTMAALQKLKQFLIQSLGNSKRRNEGANGKSQQLRTKARHDKSTTTSPCWNMMAQLPTGANATLSGGDWSGVGTGPSGESWDFQTCTILVEAIGMSSQSMFRPVRNWTIDWLADHCKSRFIGVTPQPHKLVQQWKFDDLIGAGASHILFTNGLRDGWSVSGIQNNLSDTLVTVNFPNGAHHSDLAGSYNLERDTPDIVEGYNRIQDLLSRWLESLPSYRRHEKKAVA